MAVGGGSGRQGMRWRASGRSRSKDCEAAWCVVHGDALHVLGDLPDASVDAFVTDPPYSSGGAFRGDRVKETTAKYVSTNSANKEIPPFEGDVRDQRSFTLWTALWSSEAWRAGAEGCHLVAFSDSVPENVYIISTMNVVDEL